MRTPLLVMALGLSLAGCLTIGDSGSSPGGGDDGTGQTGTGSNSGSNTGSNGGGGGSNPTPSVNVTMDRATVSTELGKEEVVTLTFSSVNSFAGNVTVAPSLTDSAGAALTTGGLSVAGPTTVALAANATASEMYTVTIPSDATATQMTANLKIDVTSSAGTKSYTSAFTIAPIYSIDYAAGLAANTAMHPMTKQKISLKKGAKISLHNSDTVVHVTHGDGGFKHEDIPTGGQPNGTYVIDTSALAVNTMGSVGCHTHGTATYATVTIVQ